MDHETPSYRTFSYFINDVLKDSIEEVFKDINQTIFAEEDVDLRHLYIDGNKFEANANKYTWVWKKATEKSRYRLYEKITALIGEINGDLLWSGMQVEARIEYVPEYLKQIKDRFCRSMEAGYRDICIRTRASEDTAAAAV